MTLPRVSAGFTLAPLAFTHWHPAFNIVAAIASLSFLAFAMRGLSKEIKAFEQAFIQSNSDQKEP